MFSILPTISLGPEFARNLLFRDLSIVPGLFRRKPLYILIIISSFANDEEFPQPLKETWTWFKLRQGFAADAKGRLQDF